jgi:hypothetical protein
MFCIVHVTHLVTVHVKQSSPTTHLRRLKGERRYSSYSFLTSALDGGELSASRPGRALSTDKGPPVPIVQEAGWAPEPVWTQRLEKNLLPLSEIKPRSPGRPVSSQTLHCLSYRCASRLTHINTATPLPFTTD